MNEIKIEYTLKNKNYVYSTSYMRLIISLLYSLIKDKLDSLIYQFA